MTDFQIFAFFISKLHRPCHELQAIACALIITCTNKEKEALPGDENPTLN